MNKEEWRVYHGFDEETMERIDLAVRLFSGKIIAINEIKKLTNVEKGV